MEQRLPLGRGSMQRFEHSGVPRFPRPPTPTVGLTPSNIPNRPQMMGAKTEILWAETKLPDGKSYFYHTITRETVWKRPEGPNVRIIPHEEWCSIKGKNTVQTKSPEKTSVRHGLSQSPRENYSPIKNMGYIPDCPPFLRQKSPMKMGQPNMGANTTVNKQIPVSPLEFPAKIKHSPVPNSPVPKVNTPLQPVMLVPQPYGMPPLLLPNFSAPTSWMSLANSPSGIPPPPVLYINSGNSQIDPKIVAKANEWSEHKNREGKSYFFHGPTRRSVWDKPQILREFDFLHRRSLQQRMAVEPTADSVNAKSAANEVKSSSQVDKGKEDNTITVDESKKSKTVDMCRPTSCTPILGTPWCVVWTGDKRVFFYNPSSRTSLWERPLELIDRHDIDELMKKVPEGKPTKVKKAEATSTTGPCPVLECKIKIAPIKAKVGQEDKSENENEKSTEPPTKKTKRSSQEVEDSDDVAKEMELTKGDCIETKDALKEANALEAEVKATKERATIPIETRQKLFREMLEEKCVSAFSTWEKELHKIVFDPRYLLLTSKERRIAFGNYVKDRVEDEKLENSAKIKFAKDSFMNFLEEVNIGQKMAYNDFVQKYCRHKMFKVVETPRERESYFYEYISNVERKKEEKLLKKKKQAKEEFLKFLESEIQDYHLKWSYVKKKFLNDRKWDSISEEEQKELFVNFQAELKKKTRASRTKKEVEEKEEHRKEVEMQELDKSEKEEKKVDAPSENVPDLVMKKPEKEGKKAGDTTIENVEDISEEEEGCILDSDDDNPFSKERKERAEFSLRKRKQEVQQTLALQTRDREKGRKIHLWKESIQEFQFMLNRFVKNSDASWRHVKTLMKDDRLWNSVSSLDEHEMIQLFNKHCDYLHYQKKRRFRELLHDAGVKVTSNWRDVRRKIRDDYRYRKFSSSDRKCEMEFKLYLNHKRYALKDEFWQLLKESKVLTYKTRQLVRNNPNAIRDIELALSNDKRYLEMESMSNLRRHILMKFLDNLERKGPPPPPTASKQLRQRETRK